ncbi:hypothetical protein BOC36_18680 [Burkholderia pseudomallei]|nr:hypothetical protein BOC36_18680 [Burkholderia pseudomallei]
MSYVESVLIYRNRWIHETFGFVTTVRRHCDVPMTSIEQNVLAHHFDKRIEEHGLIDMIEFIPNLQGGRIPIRQMRDAPIDFFKDLLFQFSVCQGGLRVCC